MKCCARLAPHVACAERFRSGPLQTWLDSRHTSSLLHPLPILTSPRDGPVSKPTIIALFRENALVLPSLCFSNWKSGWWAVLNTTLWYRNDQYWNRFAVPAHPQHRCGRKINEKCVRRDTKAIYILTAGNDYSLFFSASVNIKYNSWVLMGKETERSRSAIAQAGAAGIPVCGFPHQRKGLSFLPCSWVECKARGQEWSELSTATLRRGRGTKIKQSDSHDTK